jgi:hypothetical protein
MYKIIFSFCASKLILLLNYYLLDSCEYLNQIIPWFITSMVILYIIFYNINYDRVTSIFLLTFSWNLLTNIITLIFFNLSIYFNSISKCNINIDTKNGSFILSVIFGIFGMITFLIEIIYFIKTILEYKKSADINDKYDE